MKLFGGYAPTRKYEVFSRCALNSYSKIESSCIGAEVFCTDIYYYVRLTAHVSKFLVVSMCFLCMLYAGASRIYPNEKVNMLESNQNEE